MGGDRGGGASRATERGITSHILKAKLGGMGGLIGSSRLAHKKIKSLAARALEQRPVVDADTLPATHAQSYHSQSYPRISVADEGERAGRRGEREEGRRGGNRGEYKCTVGSEWRRIVGVLAFNFFQGLSTPLLLCARIFVCCAMMHF